MKVSFYLKIEGGANTAGIKNAADIQDNSPVNQPAKDVAIYARICYKGYKTKYYIGENISPKYWDKNTHRAKRSRDFPIHPEFNRRLDNIENEIKAVALKFANDNNNLYPNPDELKQLLSGTNIRKGSDKQQQREIVTFMGFFETFIQHCRDGIRKTKRGKPIKPGSIKNYVTTQAILKDYAKDTGKRVEFENIDMSFYTDFTTYLTKVKKQSQNYIAKNIKDIKAVLNYATELKVNTNLSFKSTGFSAITEETDSVYLPEHELKEIAGLDLSKEPKLDRVRDLFIIGCHTGLRYSDLSTLRPEQINNGIITITQNKTGKTIAIPVHSEVERIMNKYGGHLPRSLSNQKMNDALKDIAKQCKLLKKKVSISFTKAGTNTTSTPQKWELISTHTCRRSFCTNQYLDGVDPITIMAISGHRTQAAFMKYIKVAPTEHAQIIKEAWDKKSNAILTDKP